jgi:DNA replication protein DnaC
MGFILESAKKYVKDFNGKGSENIIFYGDTGLGKTHISTCIAKGIIDKGYEVVYDTAQNILKNLENEKFKNTKDDVSQTSKYTECDFLIIDDMGAEFKSSFSQAALYDLINYRICASAPMLISTNLDSPQLLEKTYEKRMVSRLIGSFRSFLFTGDDIRIKKSLKKQ